MPLARSYQSRGIETNKRIGKSRIVDLVESTPALGGKGKKLTLRQLVANFRSLFPRSDFRKLRARNVRVSGENTLSLNVRADIKPSGLYNTEDTPAFYTTWVVLRRKSLTDDFTSNSTAELRCTCHGFGFFARYADWKKKAFAGKPTSWTKVKAPIRNPKTIPAPCKHLMTTIRSMERRRIIKK